MNRSILVPLDGSALAEQALPHAATLARKMGSGLTLARVVTATTLRGDDPQEALRLALAEAESYLTRTAERLRSEGLDVAVVHDDGEPASVIMAIAHRLPTACIVMSTHGR
ncbi:MAG: universal stress protein, partial [Chloroflexi bacterium]|nr:universal stress protein [Chloroflexota bacterium]